MEYLLSDGKTFFHEEKRHLTSRLDRPFDHALGYRIVNSDPEGRYTLHKEVLADPHLSCLLQHTRLTVHPGTDGESIRLFALCAPHLGVSGWGNNAQVYRLMDRLILIAERPGVALALGSTLPFARASAGYVGHSDGWTDLSSHLSMEWEFDRALDGNVALIGEIPIHERREFTLGLALGPNREAAVTTLVQSLGASFASHRDRFVEQWDRTCHHLLPLEKSARDGGHLFRSSYSLLLAHEDKLFPGAFIASLSIPWGSTRGEDARGGYHLVWTRDMVQTAMALLAAGNLDAPLRALIYLATRQQADGGFPQNFWVDGEPYWTGIQLDEVAFPIVLAWRLHREHALQQFDPYPMVLGGLRFLIEHGPATQQDRWEELGGYSPATLAINITALICAANFARERGDSALGLFVQEYADFLESHLEPWTVTTNSTLVPGNPVHYVRIRPISVDDSQPDESSDFGWIHLPNLPPGEDTMVRASDLVDAGFLELVRYGIRPADDPIVLSSLTVVDRMLKLETPFGPCWRRYNRDGYGETESGGPYNGWGKGRAWPLLTGERGMYELSLGRDPAPFLAAMERFASTAGLLPEQVWDEADRPELHLRLGRPTESATPLAWAHAEYLKLLRSTTDGKVFDRIPEVANRYLRRRRKLHELEVWKFNRQPAYLHSGTPLRVLVPAAFRLRWTDSAWSSWTDSESTPTAIGLHWVDLPALGSTSAGYEFTFFWIESQRWEGRNFAVRMDPSTDSSS